MTRTELEVWVRQVVERARSGGPVEDSRVELKREWPEPGDAARRIAGHANAASGESILWIIGLDEKTGLPCACNREELSSWHREVANKFDGAVAPDLDQPLVVDLDGTPVMALLFVTDRAPYVVKNQEANAKIQREVPWRRATGIGTATRADLLKILLPIAKLPTMSVQEAKLQANKPDPNSWTWTLNLELYIVPPGRERVVIPYHHFWVRVQQSGTERWRAEMQPRYVGAESSTRFSYPPEGTVLVRWSPSGLIADGPGIANASFASSGHHAVEYNESAPMEVTMHARPAGTDQWLTVDATLRFVPSAAEQRVPTWQFVRRRAWEH